MKPRKATSALSRNLAWQLEHAMNASRNCYCCESCECDYSNECSCGCVCRRFS